MLNRGAFRIITLALVLALFGAAAIYSADAQDPPRPRSRNGPNSSKTPGIGRPSSGSCGGPQGQSPRGFFCVAAGDRPFSLRA